MKNNKGKAFFLFMMVLGVGAFLYFGHQTTTHNSKSQFKIRWLINEDPGGYFTQSATLFKEILENRSQGKIEVVLLFYDKFKNQYGINPKSIEPNGYFNLINFVALGETEAAQVYTSELGTLKSDYWVFDFPYLFRDESHLERVLQSQKVIDHFINIPANESVRVLNIDNIGDFRVVFTNKAIDSLKDLSKKPLRTTLSPISQKFFATIGAAVFPAQIIDLWRLYQGNLVSTTESYYLRLPPQLKFNYSHIYNFQNSAALTSVIMNESFYQHLPNDLQILVHETGLEVARRTHANIKLWNSLPLDLKTLKPTEAQEAKKWVEKIQTDFRSFFKDALPILESN